ncbi:MAG: 50S ribosomal protein L6 [Caldivirga sp.]
MAKVPYVSNVVEVPEGVSINVEGGNLNYRVTVKGPLGSLTKEFKGLPITISVRDGEVLVEGYMLNRKWRSTVYTVTGHIRNMITGVTRGWRYKLKVVYAHFPISVKVQGGSIVIENFLGRRSKITLQIPQGVKVQVAKDDVIVEGIDKDLVSQFAANIELATTLRGKQRPSPHGRESAPGILDGIYVYATENIK